MFPWRGTVMDSSSLGVPTNCFSNPEWRLEFTLQYCLMLFRREYRGLQVQVSRATVLEFRNLRYRMSFCYLHSVQCAMAFYGKVSVC